MAENAPKIMKGAQQADNAPKMGGFGEHGTGKQRLTFFQKAALLVAVPLCLGGSMALNGCGGASGSTTKCADTETVETNYMVKAGSVKTQTTWCNDDGRIIAETTEISQPMETVPSDKTDQVIRNMDDLKAEYATHPFYEFMLNGEKRMLVAPPYEGPEKMYMSTMSNTKLFEMEIGDTVKYDGLSIKLLGIETRYVREEPYGMAREVFDAEFSMSKDGMTEPVTMTMTELPQSVSMKKILAGVKPDLWLIANFDKWVKTVKLAVGIHYNGEYSVSDFTKAGTSNNGMDLVKGWTWTEE